MTASLGPLADAHLTLYRHSTRAAATLAGELAEQEQHRAYALFSLRKLSVPYAEIAEVTGLPEPRVRAIVAAEAARRRADADSGLTA